ncbi:UDP-N-acetylmuramate dehydrogenase [uncultured Eubacterium sp.]|uniref:UDP-N-acetylmuramate dehydrogenase n=1 Tax=uncultured Eubacterium sp. TaxID=165185 RepID=UPI002591E239|nr:UDP-N-acetylmuramate dehydrogenase [uncultured Eubacterium sp.]
MKQIYETLCGICGAEHVLVREPMSRHTTFRTGGPADLLVQPKAEQIAPILEVCRNEEIPWTVIGNGSNLLVGDGGIRGVVLEIGKQMSDIVIEGTVITAGAGAMLSSIASRVAAAELTGMEFASGIPGSLGGAVVMNAGAYGGEMKDILQKVTVLTPDGTVQTLSVEELELSYRHSIIPEKGYLVISAILKLQQGNADEIQSIMDDLKEKRVSKQPLEYPSAGSTFKRPEGYFAGKLIQDAGLRGFRVGGAQVSEKHCGFIINRDQATSTDICQLMQQVSEIVYEKFGVRLEPEVKKIGEF